MMKAIRIIHSKFEGKEYRLLEDFFRLMGIFVYDSTLDVKIENNDYDIVIVICNGLLEEDVEKITKRYNNAVNITIPTISDFESKKQFINCCLNEIESKVNIYNISQIKEEMKIFSEIFIEFNLSYYMQAYRYFFNNRKIVQKSQDEMVDAYIALQTKVTDKKINSPYLKYTRMNLARCINETCHFLNQSSLFDVGKCLRVSDQILELEPNFSNVYLLKAFFAEKEVRYSFLAESFYNMALQNNSKKSYNYYPVYRYGNYCDKVLKDQERATVLYRQSYDINNLEYRALYKIMLSWLREKKYQEALICCKTIINILKEKKDKNFLSPKEYEYLFNVYSKIIFIFEKLHDSNQIENTFFEINEMVSMINNENEIYNYFFQDDADCFLKLTRDKLLTIKKRII